MAFFGVWMSRDVIYVAPKDALEGIIERWRTWLQAGGARYPYPLGDDMEWYF